MFVDKVKIKLKAGKGGAGSASFRREKFVPKGGPDGGDGGNGGDVIIISDQKLKTLLDFVHRSKIEAQDGRPGSGRKRDGARGEDLLLRVPLGTTIYQNNALVYDLISDQDRFVVAKGGKGGRGNLHFKSSVRQTPRIAELGEPTTEVQLELQMKLIADVGLIGFPNGGKSTLLARLTRANPKIGDYPFTTLHPNLGVGVVNDQEVVFADIPGLIEGSHQGKGLGHEFLRHIERTRVLVHIVDPLGYQGKSPSEAIKIINQELKNHSKILADKPQIILINKADLAEAEGVYKKLKKASHKRKIFLASGVSGIGIKELLTEVQKLLLKAPPVKLVRQEKPVHVNLEPDFWVEKVADGFFQVKGSRVERLIAITNFDLPEAIGRTQQIIKKMGVERELLIRGATQGNLVKIGDIEFTFEPNSDISSSESIRRRKDLVYPI